MENSETNNLHSEIGTILKYIPSLRELNSGELELLSRIANIKYFNPEEKITAQGNLSEELLVMIQGKGEVYVDRIKIETLAIEPGTILGEFEYFSKTFGSSINAIRQSTFLSISYQDLDTLIESNPRMGLKLYKSFILESISKLKILTESLIQILATDPAKLEQDIKHPLETLKSLKNQSICELNQAAVLSIITKRIEKIANSIFGAEGGNKAANNLGSSQLETLVDELFIEKSYYLSSKPNHIRLSKNFRHLNGNSFPNVTADPSELQRVLSNLLDNSIEAMASRSPDASDSIALNVDINENSLSIQVIDNGPGIDQTVLKLLGKQSISTKTKGSNHGLGLLFAYQKIREWNGRLDIHSNLNQGTSVTISLETVKNHPYTHSKE